MRCMTISLCGIVVIGLCGGVAFGQGRGGGQARVGSFPPLPAPTDRAVIFDVPARVKELDDKNARFWRIVEGAGDAFNVNIRIETEDKPRLESVISKVWIVQRGSGTLVTGGEVVTDAAGQWTVRGGLAQSIGVGDIIFIPVGVSHGLLPGPELTWLNIRFETVTD